MENNVEKDVVVSAEMERIRNGLSQCNCDEGPVLYEKDAVKDLRFLIVDDELSSRILLQEIVADFGTSHIVADGFDGVMAYHHSLGEKRPYDIVMLDILMPGLDGKSVARSIRRFEAEAQITPLCQIFITSSLNEPSFIAEMLRTKICDAYLVKPISKMMLEECLHQGSNCYEN